MPDIKSELSGPGVPDVISFLSELPDTRFELSELPKFSSKMLDPSSPSIIQCRTMSICVRLQLKISVNVEPIRLYSSENIQLFLWWFYAILLGDRTREILL